MQQLRQIEELVPRVLFARQLSFVIVRIVLATIACALLYSVVATAAEPRATQSLESIRAAAEDYVRAAARATDSTSELFVSATELDPRLQLAACGTQLQAFLLNNAPLATRNVVAVRCQEGGIPGWTVYIPTLLESEKPVLVMRRSVPRDSHIMPEDVELQHRRVNGVGTNYVSDFETLREQHLKRGLPAGALLSVDALARDLLVKRGQEVALVFGSNGIAVRAPGIALADGGMADRIRVQNRTSLKVVEGTIESGNLVRVGM